MTVQRARAPASAPAVLDLFDGAPRAARARLRARWATCPFPVLASLLPPEGRILEVGCGHGLFSAYLALTSPSRRVLGIDVDAAKIDVSRAAARRAAGRGADLSFRAARPGALPDGPWDAIAIVDVLYLIDPPGQKRLLAACADRLAPGGVLLVKEMALRPRWKFLLNLAQETVSVRLLAITHGARFAFAPPSQIAVWMQEEGLLVTDGSLQRGYVHPHHVVVGRRPEVAREP